MKISYFNNDTRHKIRVNIAKFYLKLNIQPSNKVLDVMSTTEYSLRDGAQYSGVILDTIVNTKY